VPSGLVRDRLAAARGFVFDMDGTLVLGDRHNHRLRPGPVRCGCGCGSPRRR
jgi:4-nitrophenyl phosphatase